MTYQSESANNYNTDYNFYNSTNNESVYDGSVENYSSGYGSTSSDSVNINNTDQTNYYGSFTNSYYDNYYYSNGYSNYNYYNNYYNQQMTNSTEVLPNSNQNVTNAINIEKESVDDSIEVKLTNESLWNKFHAHTTEMILTKQGRKMFPTLQYSINGMDANKEYFIFVELVKTVPISWKYQSGKWIQCGGQLQDDAPNKHLVHMHPDSPKTGAFWMKNEILFSKLKVTNNKKAADENILLLNSMHKYIPKLHIVCADNLSSNIKKPKLSDFASDKIKTICFEQTQFIAVTAYLNRNITELKIEYNPFAKGFRDAEQNSSSNSFKTSPTVSPTHSSKIITNTSTPKMTYNSNSYYFNQENLSPKSNYNFNNGYDNSNNLSPYSNEYYKNNYYYNYNNYYNTQPIHQAYVNNTSNVVNTITNRTSSTKRKYEESTSQEDYTDIYNNCNQSKHHCSNNYNVLRNMNNLY